MGRRSLSSPLAQQAAALRSLSEAECKARSDADVEHRCRRGWREIADQVLCLLLLSHADHSAIPVSQVTGCFILFAVARGRSARTGGASLIRNSLTAAPTGCGAPPRSSDAGSSRVNLNHLGVRRLFREYAARNTEHGQHASFSQMATAAGRMNFEELSKLAHEYGLVPCVFSHVSELKRSFLAVNVSQEADGWRSSLSLPEFERFTQECLERIERNPEPSRNSARYEEARLKLMQWIELILGSKRKSRACSTGTSRSETAYKEHTERIRSPQRRMSLRQELQEEAATKTPSSVGARQRYPENEGAEVEGARFRRKELKRAAECPRDERITAMSPETQESIKAGLVRTQIGSRVSEETQESIKAGLVRATMEGRVSEDTRLNMKAVLASQRAGRCNGRVQTFSEWQEHQKQQSAEVEEQRQEEEEQEEEKEEELEEELDNRQVAADDEFYSANDDGDDPRYGGALPSPSSRRRLRARTSPATVPDPAPQEEEAPSGRPELETALARAQRKFARFDSDGNGVLDGPELLRLVEWVWSSFHPGGEPLSEEQKKQQADKLLAQLDANGDGAMDFEEFAGWFEDTCASIERFEKDAVSRYEAAVSAPTRSRGPPRASKEPSREESPSPSECTKEQQQNNAGRSNPDHSGESADGPNSRITTRRTRRHRRAWSERGRRPKEHDAQPDENTDAAAHELTVVTRRADPNSPSEARGVSSSPHSPAGWLEQAECSPLSQVSTDVLIEAFGHLSPTSTQEDLTPASASASRAAPRVRRSRNRRRVDTVKSADLEDSEDQCFESQPERRSRSPNLNPNRNQDRRSVSEAELIDARAQQLLLEKTAAALQAERDGLRRELAASASGWKDAERRMQSMHDELQTIKQHQQEQQQKQRVFHSPDTRNTSALRVSGAMSGGPNSPSLILPEVPESLSCTSSPSTRAPSHPNPYHNTYPSSTGSSPNQLLTTGYTPKPIEPSVSDPPSNPLNLHQMEAAGKAALMWGGTAPSASIEASANPPRPRSVPPPRVYAHSPHQPGIKREVAALLRQRGEGNRTPHRSTDPTTWNYTHELIRRAGSPSFSSPRTTHGGPVARSPHQRVGLDMHDLDHTPARANSHVRSVPKSSNRM